MNYKETLEYIKSLQKLGSKPGLSRVAELSKLMGNPQNDLKIIHVTGTNGKGSTCAMIESVLVKAGYKTGKFSSPWIEKINEYICINGETLSDDDFAKAISEAKEFADKMLTTQQRVSEWECNKIEPSLSNIIKILKIFDVTFEELIDGIEEKSNLS